MTLQVGDLIPIGGSGNVKKTEVLEGKTYSSDEGADLVGTMPNQGSSSKTITTQNGTHKISPGYYSGGEVKAQFNNLTSNNIKQGINVGGIIGNYMGLIADLGKLSLLERVSIIDKKYAVNSSTQISKTVPGNKFTVVRVYGAKSTNRRFSISFGNNSYLHNHKLSVDDTKGLYNTELIIIQGKDAFGNHSSVILKFNMSNESIEVRSFSDSSNDTLDIYKERYLFIYPMVDSSVTLNADIYITK